MRKKPTIHDTVLSSLEDEKILFEEKEYRFLIEKRGSRLDLPRKDLTSSKKEPGQRKKNLLYVDAALIDESKKARMFIEVVDKSPNDPSGIVGLVVNVDRLAKEHYPEVDLLFIVLGQMKNYCCSECKPTQGEKPGHKAQTHSHFRESWETVKTNKPLDILHEGVAMNYRKALLDYPLCLKYIRSPSILFTNSGKVRSKWEQGYKQIVLSQIKKHISERLGCHDRNATPLFIGVEALFPESLAKTLGTA